jgi:Cep192 domain 4/Abnormal spindle-like microcephaly-assoc'd, ASPM-SPD-2-Hydin/HYDIN/CFA65/VesB-like, Ig-like domain
MANSRVEQDPGPFHFRLLFVDTCRDNHRLGTPAIISAALLILALLLSPRPTAASSGVAGPPTIRNENSPSCANCKVGPPSSPSATGTQNAGSSVPAKSVGSPGTVSTVTKTGTTAGPAVSLSSTSLNFGNQPVHTTSLAQTFTLTNTGGEPLSIMHLSIMGAGATDFVQTNNCGESLSAGANCTVAMTFTPSSVGTRLARFIVSGNAASGQQDLPLSGTGTAPLVSLSPTSINFSSQAVGTTSATQIITLVNSGNATLNISNIGVTGAVSGEFTETNTCGASVAQNTTCTISIRFTPSSVGMVLATLNIIDNASAMPQTVNLSGSGESTAPSVSFSPTSLSFPGQTVGTSSAAKTVTLSNTGNAALTLSSIALTGTNAADFAQSNNCGSSVAAGASCTLSVTFTPSASGTRSATLSVTDNASGSPQSVSLSGSAVVPGVLAFIQENDAEVNSGATVSVAFNSPNAAGNLIVAYLIWSNTGTVSVSDSTGNAYVSAQSATKWSGSQYSAQVFYARNIAGGSNTVTATFGTAVSSFGLLYIHEYSGLDAANPLDVSTAASGTGSAMNSGTATTVSPVDLLFGAGVSSAAVTAGDANYTVRTISHDNITEDRTVNSTGAYSATATQNGNAWAMQMVAFRAASSTYPVLTLSSASLTFASQAVGTTSAAQTVTLNNTGSAGLTITSIAVTGTNASDFAQSNNCGSSVAPGSNCTISVTFTPTATGSRAAAVTIADNASGSPQTVALTGTGTGPLVSLSPASLTFANQAVGTTSAAQTVTLKNTGNAALTLSGIALSGTNAGDFAQSNNCGSSLAAGASCTLSVTFKPSATGIRTASLTVTDNAPGSPQSVSLSGNTAPSVSLSPASLTFASQAVMMTSSPQTVTLTNSGSATLTITSIAFTGTHAGDFSEADNCNGSVAAGATCTIAVLFTPSAAGTRTAALSVADNASGSPQSVSLSGTGAHDVILSWTASSTPGIMGYYVFRGTSKGGEGSTPLNSTPAGDTTFADENVTSGTTYYYVVKTVASDGVTLSAPSNEATATAL